MPERPLPDSPFVIDTAEQGPVRVTVIKGLALPWDLAFLPNGDMLATERPSMQLRIVRNGALDAEPVTGLPEISSASAGGLMSVKVHPQFEDNGWVYLWDRVQRPETENIHTAFYFAFAYMTVLPASALVLALLESMQLTRLRHFAVTGLLAGVVCSILSAGEAIVAFIAIGPLVGAFVWFISEWHRKSEEPVT